jgi:hypothetical protein
MTPQLAAALAALTQQVTGLTNAVTILAGAKGGGTGPGPKAAAPAAGSGAGDAVGAAVGMAVGKFAILFAPIIALSNVLNQTASGMGVFMTAIKVLGATLAPLLLPVFLLLAAAVLSVSDEIWSSLLPNLKAWYEWILANAIPVLEQFVAAVRDVIAFIKGLRDDPEKAVADAAGKASEVTKEKPEGDSWASAFWSPGRWLGDQINKAAGLDDAPAAGKSSKELSPGQPYTPRPPRPGEPAGAGTPPPAARGADEGAGGGPGFWERAGGRLAASGPGGFAALAERAMARAGQAADRQPTPRERFQIALRDVVQSVRQQAGPPAQIINDPTGVNRGAQLASITADPLERRIKERLLQALDAFDGAAAAVKNIDQNTKPKPAGLFEGE